MKTIADDVEALLDMARQIRVIACERQSLGNHGLAVEMRASSFVLECFAHELAVDDGRVRAEFASEHAAREPTQPSTTPPGLEPATAREVGKPDRRQRVQRLTDKATARITATNRRGTP